MSRSTLDQLIPKMENYLECWKQFNYYIGLARSKKFNEDDENQFLEIKCVIAQELEMILDVIETSSPSKDEVLSLLGSAPSIRYLSELNEGSLRMLESQWHKIYIGWQSILGQLKVKQGQGEKRSFLGRLFGK